MLTTTVVQAVYACVLFGLVLLASMRREYLLVAYVALVPWLALQFDVGVTIGADRAAAVLLLAFSLKERPGRAHWGLAALVVYAVANTMFQSLHLPESIALYPPLRGQWRWASQLVMWTIYFSPVIALIRSPPNIDIRVLYRAYVWSVGVLAILGIAQSAAFLLLGVDIFPINILSVGAELRSGMFDNDAIGDIFRASSFGGEPKHFAYSLAAGLAILQADGNWGGPLGLGLAKRRILLGTLGAAIVLTFSTQGLALAAFNVVFLTMFAPSRTGVANNKRWSLIMVVVVLAAGLWWARPELFDVVKGRTIDRLQMEGTSEDSTQVVMAWLAANPSNALFGVGLGNVHLHAAPFVPDLFDYMRTEVFVAKSGIVRVVSEIGVIGLILLGVAFGSPLSSIRRGRTALGGMHVSFAWVVAANFALTNDGPLLLLLVMGVSYYLADRIQAERPEMYR